MTLREQIFLNSIPEPNSGCWLWLGKIWNGYGRLHHGWAHRIAWIVFIGPIPMGKNVLHKCDLGICVNPDHLFLGTQRDNLQDCAAKRRNGYKIFHGENHWKAKFTADEVIQIKSSDLSRRELAQMFGVSEWTIKHVRSNRSWKKLQGETNVYGRHRKFDPVANS